MKNKFKLVCVLFLGLLIPFSTHAKRWYDLPSFDDFWIDYSWTSYHPTEGYSIKGDPIIEGQDWTRAWNEDHNAWTISYALHNSKNGMFNLELRYTHIDRNSYGIQVEIISLAGQFSFFKVRKKRRLGLGGSVGYSDDLRMVNRSELAQVEVQVEPVHNILRMRAAAFPTEGGPTYYPTVGINPGGLFEFFMRNYRN